MKDQLDPEAAWNFFGLTRSSYLVMPRIALQSMPVQWQNDFVKLVEQMPETLPELSELEPHSYVVNQKDEKGKFVSSKFPSYRHNKLKSIHDEK